MLLWPPRYQASQLGHPLCSIAASAFPRDPCFIVRYFDLLCQVDVAKPDADKVRRFGRWVKKFPT